MKINYRNLRGSIVYVILKIIIIIIIINRIPVVWVWMCSGLMVSALDSRSSGPDSILPGTLCYVLGQNTLLSQQGCS